MTHKFPSNPPSSKLVGGQAGSVLLVTLLILSLLLMLVLSFTVYVRMEIRSISSHMDQKQAEANAVLGLELALGRLQHLAGPDQRVTAGSSLFDGGTGNPYRPGLSASSEKLNWTGVWNSASREETDPSVKHFMGWLASSPDTAEWEQVDSISVDPDPTDAVALVDAGSVWFPEDQAWARKVPIQNSSGNRNGSYAFWVGDEGRKAKFGTRNPYREATSGTEQFLSLQAPQRIAAEVMSADGEPLLDTYDADDPAFPRLVNETQLDLLDAPFGRFRRERFHDITLYSSSVPSNTKTGGLKEDLTLAFEMPLEDFRGSEFAAASPNAWQPVYRPPGFPASERLAPVVYFDTFTPWLSSNPENDPQGNPPRVRGPSWHLLRNYYRLYKNSDSDPGAYGLGSTGGVNQAGGNWWISGRNYYPAPKGLNWMRRYGQDHHAWEWAERTDGGGTALVPRGHAAFPAVAPVVVRVQTILSFNSRPVEGGYELDLYVDPVVTLWNPYNVELEIGTAEQPLKLSVKYLNPDIQFHWHNTTSGETLNPDLTITDLDDINRQIPSSDEYRADREEFCQLRLHPNRRMEPGEVIVFSGRNGTVDYVRNVSGEESGVTYDLYPGIHDLASDSGLRMPNVANSFWRSAIKARFPDGLITEDWQVRFRLIPREAHRTMKFNVDGVDGPRETRFLGSIQGSVGLNTPFNEARMIDHSSLRTRKLPFAYYDVNLKSESSEDPIHMFAHFNPRAYTTEQGTVWELMASMLDVGSTDDKEDLFGGTGRTTTQFDDAIHVSGENGFWGSGVTAGTGRTHVVAYEVPLLPMLSLGDLQHAPVSLVADEPAYPIGNSLADPFVGFGKFDLQAVNSSQRVPPRNDWTVTRVDWSYVLNDVLWDGYYFSGLVPVDGSNDFRAPFDAHLTEHAPLANARNRIVPRVGLNVSGLRDELFTASGAPKPDSPSRIGGNLMMDGAFNINSTSLEAWKALLSAARDVSVETSNSGTIPLSSKTFAGRHTRPRDGENVLWTGFRTLSDSEIDTLAREIVAQVRARGPFLTLGDFVNRQLAASSDPATVTDSMRKGALQTAIDEAGLNQGRFTETLSYSDLQQPMRGRLQEMGHNLIAMSANGHLTQADMLSVIGPLLTPRSDTFRIRSYGERVDANGNTIARAWCEAIVQRLPDYQDSTVTNGTPPAWEPHETPPNANTYDTAIPRRRFRILSFKWLNEDDV